MYRLPMLKTYKILCNIMTTTPTIQIYTVAVGDTLSTLEALLKIQHEQDPMLYFKRPCADGTCGSCALVVDGINCLACMDMIRNNGKPTTVYPILYQTTRQCLPKVDLKSYATESVD
jgi:succinate dehydrogenase/fumarate reductase-like Fe-S protein